MGQQKGRRRVARQIRARVEEIELQKRVSEQKEPEGAENESFEDRMKRRVVEETARAQKRKRREEDTTEEESEEGERGGEEKAGAPEEEDAAAARGAQRKMKCGCAHHGTPAAPQSAQVPGSPARAPAQSAGAQAQPPRAPVARKRL